MSIILTKIPLNDVIKRFSEVPIPIIFAYILTLIAIMITQAWRWQIIISSQQKTRLSLWHLFWYRIIGYGVSYVTPTAKIGGEPVRAALLTRHKIKFKEGLTTVVIDKTLELSSSGLFFVIGSIIALASYPVPSGAKTPIIIFSLIAAVLIFYFYYQMLNGGSFFKKTFRGLQLHRSKKGKKLEKHIHEFEQLIIKFYQHEKKYFFAAIMISLLSWILMFIEFKLALFMVG